MTARTPSSLALLATFGLLAGMSSPALADDRARPFDVAQAKGDKNDDKDDRKGKRNYDKRGNDGPKQQGGDAAQGKPRDKPDRKPDRKEADQGRPDAMKKKLDAFKEKQQGEKDKRQVESLREQQQKALKQRQLEAQQAKEKERALKEKQQADRARDEALKKQQQIESQKARDNANKDKLGGKDRPGDKDRSADRPGDRDKFGGRDRPDDKDKFGGKDRPDDKDKLGGRDRPDDRDKLGGKEPPKGNGNDRFDRAKADSEFERARERAKGAEKGAGPGDREKWNDARARKFEDLRKQRKEQKIGGSRDIITEPDKRVIVRDKNRAFIRHDETERFKRTGREVRRERQKDGSVLVVTMGLAGALIYSFEDDHGRLLRRTRKGRDGRELVLIDNRRYYRSHPWPGYGAAPVYDSYVDLPPPVVRIPRNKYIVEYEEASPDDIYEALSAPPVEELGRGYSLDEVRQSYDLLERMRRVDLSSITFDFGSWEVGPDQYQKLSRIADAIRRILDRSPDEMFLIEGHTDAVGSDIDNLSLSDRRAESVAVVLTEEFGIPPENLVTQGYGEQYLKVPTEEPSRANRRVAVRRITPLLDRQYSER